MALPHVFVDSGAWIALISADDSHHAEADTIFHKAIRERVRLLTTNLIIAETHRFVLHRAGIHAAAAVLRHIESSPLLTIAFASTADHGTARQWLAKFSDQALTYTDAISFAVMTATGCAAAITFDRHFAIAGFRTWQVGGR